MTDILTQILAIHNDPKRILSESLTDKQINVPVLAKRVSEDEQGWFIEHNGELILYCAKHCKSKPETDGIHNLENMLVDCWHRYTRKPLREGANFGYKA